MARHRRILFRAAGPATLLTVFLAILLTAPSFLSVSSLAAERAAASMSAPDAIQVPDAEPIEKEEDCTPGDTTALQQSQTWATRAVRLQNPPRQPARQILRVRIVLDRSSAQVWAEDPTVETHATFEIAGTTHVEKWVNNQWVSAHDEWSVCYVDMSAHFRVSPPAMQFYRPRGVGPVDLTFVRVFGRDVMFTADYLQTKLQREGGLRFFRVAVLAGDTAVITIQERVSVLLLHRSTRRLIGPIRGNLDASAREPISVTVKHEGP